MTPSEFKAWFDGFTEAFGSRVPTKAQWARVKERVSEIDGKPVTERVYVDRYWPQYRPYWLSHGHGVSALSTNSAGVGAIHGNASNQYSLAKHGVAFNSSQAMTDLGRADAASLAS